MREAKEAVPKVAATDIEPTDPVEELNEILRRFLIQLDAIVETVLRVMVILIENEKESSCRD